MTCLENLKEAKKSASLYLFSSFTETTKVSSFGKWEIIQIKKKNKSKSTGLASILQSISIL